MKCICIDDMLSSSSSLYRNWKYSLSPDISYEERVYRQVVCWQITWMLLVTTVCISLLIGYVVELFNEHYRLVFDIDEHLKRGPPIGCYGMPIPQQTWGDWLMGVNKYSENACAEYIKAISRSTCPNFFKVAIRLLSDTVVVPVENVLMTISAFVHALLDHFSFFTQMMLVVAVALGVVGSVYIYWKERNIRQKAMVDSFHQPYKLDLIDNWYWPPHNKEC